MDIGRWYVEDNQARSRQIIANDSIQVVETACGDRSPEIHNANVFDMNAKMADVVSEEEAVTKLKAGKSS